MSKHNRILAVVLALQVVVAAIVFWPRSAAITGNAPLLSGMAADKVTGITISDGTGQQVVLAKKAEGWVLPLADDYPCLGDKVTSLVGNIAALMANRLVTQTSESHKQLKVADGDFERSIELELSDGTRHRLFLGVQAGFQATHVRVQGKNEVYLESGLSTMDVAAQPSAWVDTQYLNVPLEQLAAVKVENAGGALEFERAADGAWSLKGLADGEKASADAIQALVNQATAVYLLEPLGKQEKESYGLKTPAAVVTLTTRDQDGTAKTYTLRLGTSDPKDGSYVAISSESAYYVRLAAYGVQDLVTKGRQDYLELPPTPGAVEVTPTP